MSSLEAAAAAIGRGRMVVIRSREGHGGVTFAAAHADVEKMAFLIQHSSGFLCVTLPPERCDELAIPPMCSSRRDDDSAAFCVAVDARSGTTTGISARDRALTARRLADPRSTPEDFVRPGHVVPVATAAPLSALSPPRLSQAAASLTRLAGLEPVAVFGHLVSPSLPTQLATDDELAEFAAAHGIAELDLRDRAAGPSRNGHAVLHG